MLLIFPDTGEELRRRTLEALQERDANLPAIVVSSNDGEEVIEAFLNAGVWDYVSLDSLWRLPVLARRILDDYSLRERFVEVEDRWAGVAHDVSNLLTTVLGHSELILRRAETDEDLRRSVEGLLMAGEAAASWMKQYATGGPLETTGLYVDLNQVIAGMESMLRLLAGGNIELRLQLGPNPMPVTADPAQLARAIVNLALNARDAMPEGGCLTIQTKAALALAEGARGNGNPGPWAKLTVIDTGRGIEKQRQPRLFDRFHTTKEQHQGLGLATVRTLAERCGGFTELQSTQGVGTAVSIYLPCAAQSSDKAETMSDPQPFSNASRKVLVVDDDPPLREVLSHTLSLAGYGVLQAGTAQEALEIQRQQPACIDLLLTDLRMAPMDGRTLAGMLRARNPRMKVIYISGYPNHGACSLEENAEFLMKPFKPTALLEKIRAVLTKA